MSISITILSICLVIFPLNTYADQSNKQSHENLSHENLNHKSSNNRNRTVSLLDYVYLALTESDQVFDGYDQIAFSRMDMESAQYQFQSKIVPLASLGAGDNINSQSYGFEVSKQLEFGTKLSSGVSASTSYDDSSEVATTNAYIQISQDLYRGWGKKYNRAALSIAELNQVKANLLFDRTKQDTIKQAVQKYYQALLADMMVKSSLKSFQRAENNLSFSRSRQSVGLVSKSDVYRAELALLNAETTYKDQKYNLVLMLEELNDFIRVFDLNYFFIDSEISRFSPVIPENWQSDLLNKHLDWIAFQADIDIAEYNSFRIQRGLRPDVALSLKLDETRSGDSFTDESVDSEFGWSVQLQLKSTFDMFNEKQSYQRQRMEMARLGRYGEKLKRKIFRNIRNSIEELRVENRRIDVSSRKIVQAEKAYDLAILRYERGLISNLELIEAENDLYSSELENLRAKVGYNIASVDLAYDLSVLSEDWLRKSMLPIEINSN